jgi:hypothetical protein
MKLKKFKTIFKTKEIEIIKEMDIRNDLKHLNSFIIKNPVNQESVYIHYNYLPHILKILNENK